jgi:hypothetical protein
MLPEARLQRRDLDFAATSRRVNELVVAEVDADVREREAPGVEEDEIAWLQVADHDLGAEAAHVPGCARQRDADDLLKHVAHEAAAIEPVSGVLPPHLYRMPMRIQRRGGEILRGF